MEKLMECVPNFSEGREKSVINKITNAIKSVKGITLLDVDPGYATNRTVVTFVGDPDSVIEAAFQGIKMASELIDMRQHKGAHARMGATDVCPLIPVSGLTEEECIHYSKMLGERVGKELNIPVYLYEKSAVKEERRNLAVVRSGEYEGLADKLVDPNWKPDFGPTEYSDHIAKTGATIIGVREFLIAYNVNLNTRNKKLAHNIALNIREKGRKKRDANGKVVKDVNGKAIMVPGKFKYVKAVGWYIPEYKQAQISINFTNYKKTPIHIVVDEIRKEAMELGLVVTGSELVGLIPKDALLEAGKYYLRKQGVSPGVSERDLIDTAIRSLGLSDLTEFDPYQKIIEYRIGKENRLVDMTLVGFVDELASASPAPGGGSVAALVGSIASALVSMVANLTTGKKKFKTVEKQMFDISEKAQTIKENLLALIDKDTEAFNKVMESFALPKKTDNEILIRNEAIEEATKFAVNVPLETANEIIKIIPLIESVINSGNQNSITDAGVAALTSKAALKGALFNAKVNLTSLKDTDFIQKTKNNIKEIEQYESKLEELSALVEERIE